MQVVASGYCSTPVSAIALRPTLTLATNTHTLIAAM